MIQNGMHILKIKNSGKLGLGQALLCIIFYDSLLKKLRAILGKKIKPKNEGG